MRTRESGPRTEVCWPTTLKAACGGQTCGYKVKPPLVPGSEEGNHSALTDELAPSFSGISFTIFVELSSTSASNLSSNAKSYYLGRLGTLFL